MPGKHGYGKKTIKKKPNKNKKNVNIAKATPKRKGYRRA